jgi:predicted CoA-binding protein
METSTRPIEQAAHDFLSHRRIAVTGVSRAPTGHGSNAVYTRLKDRGYEVFAVNPNADEVEGDRSYSNLKAIEGGVDAVVVATRPDHAEATMRECVEVGVKKVWMHRSLGQGSLSVAATEYGRSHGIEVIDGGCPLMFDPCADGGHKAMKWILTLTGNVPKRV